MDSKQVNTHAETRVWKYVADDDEVLTASLQEERKDVASDENLSDPLVSDQSVAQRAGSGDEAPESHVYGRCKQCLLRGEPKSVTLEANFRRLWLIDRLTGATNSRIACMMYGPRVQFGDSLPDMMRPMNPTTSTGQCQSRGLQCWMDVLMVQTHSSLRQRVESRCHTVGGLLANNGTRSLLKRARRTQSLLRWKGHSGKVRSFRLVGISLPWSAKVSIVDPVIGWTP